MTQGGYKTTPVGLHPEAERAKLFTAGGTGMPTDMEMRLNPVKATEFLVMTTAFRNLQEIQRVASELLTSKFELLMERVNEMRDLKKYLKTTQLKAFTEDASIQRTSILRMPDEVPNTPGEESSLDSFSFNIQGPDRSMLEDIY